MLRTKRLARPTDRERPWLLYCDRCGWAHPHGLSEPAALELDQEDCFNCEVDPDRLRLAQAFSEAYTSIARN